MKDLVIGETKPDLIENQYKDTIKAILNCSPEEFAERYREYKKAEEEFKKVYEPLKEGLLRLHENAPDLANVVIIGGVKMTYVSPSVRTSIDSKLLKEEEPEIAKKFTKTTEVGATIKILGE